MPQIFQATHPIGAI